MADQLFSDGEIYERLMGRWSRLVGKTFLAWLDTPKNLQWLDVGCGNGAFTEELIAHCAPAKMVAIDPSDDQLVYARKLAAWSRALEKAMRRRDFITLIGGAIRRRRHRMMRFLLQCTSRLLAHSDTSRPPIIALRKVQFA
jgi:SAM-dependent methyltransferase